VDTQPPRLVQVLILAHETRLFAAPSNRVEECVEADRVIEVARRRKDSSLEDARARLDLPDDTERLVRLGIILYRAQRYEMLRLSGRIERLGREGSGFNINHDPRARPNFDELPLGWRGR
jgi:hypothetical protein